MEKRVISTELFEEENRTENSLRPKLLSDYIGQAKAKEKLILKRRKHVVNRLTMCFCTGLPDWERRRLPGLLPMKWM